MYDPQSVAQMGSVIERFSLKGKVAIVTGAGGGIGKATAAAFCELGAAVVLTDLPQKEEEMRRNCSEIVERFGGRAIYVTGDVSDETSVKRFVAEAVKELGTIDILHNNAGIVVRGESMEMPLEDWQKSFGVNMTGVFLVGRECANVMKAHGHGGSIINTASLSAHVINTGPAYCSNKAGIKHLTAAMALAYINDNIRVNSVSFGYVLSGIHLTSTPPDKLIERYTFFGRNTPIQRMARLDETVGSVMYLASDLSSYQTGSDIIVDGGAAVDRMPKNIL